MAFEPAGYFEKPFDTQAPVTRIVEVLAVARP